MNDLQAKSTNSLALCPFCNSEAVLDKVDEGAAYRPWFWYTVHCSNRDCVCADLCHEYETEAEAIAAWNTRAYLNPDGLPVGLTLSEEGALLNWRGENYVKQSTLGGGTLTAEQVREAIERNFGKVAVLDDGKPVEWRDDWVCKVGINYRAIADELNRLGGGKAKDLLLRTFGLAQMMHDCWLEECKAGDNVDVSACNAYSYEFDQVAQAMFDMGIDPNDSDYYRSAEMGSGTCKITATVTNNLMYPDYMTKWYELSCGHSLTLKGDEAPKWCAVCGKAVER